MLTAEDVTGWCSDWLKATKKSFERKSSLQLLFNQLFLTFASPIANICPNEGKRLKKEEQLVLKRLSNVLFDSSLSDDHYSFNYPFRSIYEGVFMKVYKASFPLSTVPAQKSFILFYFEPSSGQINHFIYLNIDARWQQWLLIFKLNSIQINVSFSANPVTHNSC